MPDYGIDGQVELFDTKGLATGFMFLVQLKATDIQELSEALAISIKTETFSYYRKLDLPVMLVRYHAPTGKLYWRWFHDFHVDPGRASKDSVTLRIPEASEWDEATHRIIEADLKTFRALGDPALKLPVEFTLQFEESSIHGVSSTLVEAALLEKSKSTENLVLLTRRARIGSHPAVSISDEKTVVSLAGLNSLTLHTRGKYPKESATKEFPHDVMTAIAFVLSRAGHANEAAQVACEHLDKGTLRKGWEVFIELLGAIAKAQRSTEALRLADRILQSADSRDRVPLLLFAVLSNRESLTTQESEYFKEVMRRVIEKAKSTGNKTSEATAHYNLGNYLRAAGIPFARAAFKHYRLASKLDPAYRERGYFWQELAGVLFLLGHFKTSSVAYEKALELGVSAKTKALRADALMFSGEYGKALKFFEEYLERSSGPDSEWQLKLLALRHIVFTLGIERQCRERSGANSLADVGNLSCDERTKNLRDAVNKDALSGLAWFNIGVERSSCEAFEDAFIAFLLASLCQPNDLEAWCNALVCSFNVRQFKNMVLVAKAANRINGGDFLRELQKRIDQFPLGFPVGEFMFIIGEIVRGSRHVPVKPTLRLLGGGADFQVVSDSEESANSIYPNPDDSN